MTTCLSQTNWDNVLQRCRVMQRQQRHTVTVHDKEDTLYDAVCDLLCTCKDEYKFSDENHLCLYLVRVAQNKAIDAKRKKMLCACVSDIEGDNTDAESIVDSLPSHDIGDPSLSLDYQNILGSLNQRNVQMFTLAVHGYTVKEIAHLCNLNVDNVTSTIRRVRSFIQNSLREYAV